MLADEGKWQPLFTSIIEDAIEKCLNCSLKCDWSTKPQGTLPRAMDFNEIISVDLKELATEYRNVYSDNWTNQTKSLFYIHIIHQSPSSVIRRWPILTSRNAPCLRANHLIQTENCRFLKKPL